MNGRREYIITEITQRKGGQLGRRGRPRKGSYVAERSWGFPSSSEESLLLGTLGHPIMCVYHPWNELSPYQSPTFGPTLYKFIVMDYGLKTVTLQLAPFMGKLFVWRWVRELAKVGPNSFGETMVANLLSHKERTARRFPAQRASGTMCAALVPTRGQTTREPRGRPPLGPDGGRRRPRESLSRGSVVRLVLEDWYWCLLTHWSSWIGL